MRLQEPSIARFSEFEPEPDTDTWTEGEEGEQSPAIPPPQRVRSVFDDLSLGGQETLDSLQHQNETWGN